jgi:hypothetical protein
MNSVSAAGSQVPSPEVPSPAWRTVAEEARLRGMNPRTLRALLRAHHVEMRGTKKTPIIRPAAVDAVWEKAPVLSQGSPAAALDAWRSTSTPAPKRRR